MSLRDHWVPILYKGPFNSETAKALAEGRSTLGDHIREGVVIRPVKERVVHSLGRLQLKIVGNSFYEKESK